MSQTHDLHRALLRPSIIHTLRAAGFHSTKPSVLDTLVDIAERYMLLLASTTAQYAHAAHNTPQPTVTDVRLALQDCGVLIPLLGAGEEEWRERMRKPLSEMAKVPKGGRARVQAERRRREEEDLKDVRDFVRWFDGPQYAEIRRVAGLMPDTTSSSALPAVGVGGGLVHADDFLTVLKKKHSKTGDDSRLVGTALGRPAEDKPLIIEGGPVQSLRDWRPRLEERPSNVQSQLSTSAKQCEQDEGDTSTSTLSHGTLDHEDINMQEVELADNSATAV